MARGVRLSLVGSVVLVSLAGCGRGFFQSAEREPWRAEAEMACLQFGGVKGDGGGVARRADPRSRHVRGRISVEGRGPWRGVVDVWLCRRRSAAAGVDRQRAALAYPATAAAELSAEFLSAGAAVLSPA